MDYKFNTKEELYIRVKPALRTKLEELKRLNFRNIKEDDIWDYLSSNIWSNSNNLTLFDIVNDIMHIDPKILSQYKKDKKKGVNNEEEKE